MAFVLLSRVVSIHYYNLSYCNFATEINSFVHISCLILLLDHFFCFYHLSIFASLFIEGISYPRFFLHNSQQIFTTRIQRMGKVTFSHCWSIHWEGGCTLTSGPWSFPGGIAVFGPRSVLEGEGYPTVSCQIPSGGTPGLHLGGTPCQNNQDRVTLPPPTTRNQDVHTARAVGLLRHVEDFLVLH